MQKGITATFAALLIATMGFVLTKANRHTKSNDEASSQVLSAQVSSGSAPTVGAVAAAGGGATAPNDQLEPGDSSTGTALVDDAARSGFAGGAVPALPEDSPKQVSFGVVLFSYKGAQGARPNAPDKETARKRALEALPEAERDFEEASKKGDTGSTTNAGLIPRGILEPAIEYVMFTLEAGKVFPEPVDTPRGFWILRRNN